MVKFVSWPKVYVVSRNGLLRWVTSESIAVSLYGSDWNQKIHDISDAFFSNYQFGSDITSASDYNPANETSVVSTINIDKGFSAPFLYHGVATHNWSTLFITPASGQANAIKSEVDAYEAAVGRTVAWVGFAHEWKTDGRAFPSKVATSIKNRGATPFIFLNLRSFDVIDKNQPVEPLYTLAAIISGQFDSDLAAWADGAKNFGSEIIVDWGWEMNGDWATWNGRHNGGQSEGPRRFGQAYRHIVELMRKRGATNIRWAFHINYPEYPAETWNNFENYYPGDDVIDLIGVSIYSAQTPTDDFFPSFESMMEPAYTRLNSMAPTKPIYVFEFGATAGNPLGSSVTWADKALSAIFSGRWPSLRGFAWWNDFWENDDNPAHDTEMRVEKVSGLDTVFKSRLGAVSNLGDRPPVFR
ncbi:beta-mannanase [Patescibacteria group bacterium]|nr:MAG: beta-mannanase [Patescibacteria group bacterium]